MTARAYYNEIDPAAVAVLRQLIADGVIADGEVDSRSIKDVSYDEIRGFTQYHWFAGGGLWSVACRMAGWPDERPIWTGSCPCQPFSAAGKGGGTDDPRHLWPDLFRLVGAARPAFLVGEQVAGAAGYGWFDGVRADLEGEGYASRAVDFPACSVDAPHQRNRLYWVAMEHAASERRGEGRPEHELWSGRSAAASADAPGVPVGDAFGSRLEGHAGHGDGGGRSEPHRSVAAPDGARATGVLADSEVSECEAGLREDGPQQDGSIAANRHGCDSLHADTDRGGRAGREEASERGAPIGAAVERHLLRNGTYWSDAGWIVCHDDKARRAKPGLRLLVDGLPGRVDLWRVGGNAIVPEAAAEVIAALAESHPPRSGARP